MESSGSSTSSKTGGEASTSSGATTATPSGKTSKKVCGVCGDRAKSYHFGGVSCDSCKAFFRRSVQNDAYKNFQCPYERRCEINVNSRKCCQYCRFHKCLHIGMETGWVMSEEERLQLLRQRMERKAKQQQQQHQQQMMAVGAPLASGTEEDQPLIPDDASLVAALGQQRAAMLSEIVDKYAASLKAVPYSVEVLRPEASVDQPARDTMSMFTTTFERMAHFAGSLDSFRQISRGDRTTLLRHGMIEAVLIRAAHAYDANRDRWPDTDRPQYRSSPWLAAADLCHLVSPELQASHAHFNRALYDMQLDERTLMVLLLVVLYSPDRPGLQQPQEVARIQESYLLLLQSYMNFRYGLAARKLFAELLLKLPDLRQLNDAFTQSQLRLSQGDIVQFQHQYGAIFTGHQQHPHSGGSGSGTISTATASAPPSPSGGSRREHSPVQHPRASSAFTPSTSGSISPPSYPFQTQSLGPFGPFIGHSVTLPMLQAATMPFPRPSTSSSSFQSIAGSPYPPFLQFWPPLPMQVPSGALQRSPRPQSIQQEHDMPKNGTRKSS